MSRTSLNPWRTFNGAQAALEREAQRRGLVPAEQQTPPAPAANTARLLQRPPPLVWVGDDFLQAATQAEPNPVIRQGQWGLIDRFRIYQTTFDPRDELRQITQFAQQQVRQWFDPEAAARAREAQRRADAEHREYLQALETARALLERFLTDRQRADLRDLGAFTVHGQYFDYRVFFDACINVLMLRKDGGAMPELKLCALPIGVPVGDVVLAQKLWLETDELAFIRHCNVFGVGFHAMPADRLDTFGPWRKLWSQYACLPSGTLPF